MIAHIFNEIDSNENRLFIENAVFDLDYIDKVIECFENGKKICEVNHLKNDINEEAKFGLKEISEKSIIDEFDNQKIDRTVEELGEKVLLISGDFFGIQDFIFRDLDTKKAAKIMRARSAMVQLISKGVVEILKKEIGAREVLFGAGKFLVVADLKNKGKIREIQEKLNDYFFKKYFGLSGMVLSFVEVRKEDIKRVERNIEIERKLLELSDKNEIAKFEKFNLKNRDVLIKIFEDAKKEDEICEFCKKRIKVNEACEVCENEIKLGTLLTKFDYLTLSFKESVGDNEILIMEWEEKKFVAGFGNKGKFDISNKKMSKLPKWPLKAYVPLNEKKIKSFEEIEGNKSGLMVLKADIDRLGNTFMDFYFDSFKKFNRLSREINFFFANYVPYLIENRYKNIYVVFAGGDDLFIVGPYDEVVEFAKDIREKFVKFSLEKATLSMGLVMFKHSTPIMYVSEMADEAEKRSKSVVKNGKDRDGINIFGISMKFDEFLDIEKRWESIYKSDFSMSFLYRLIEIAKMREKMNSNPKNAVWRSKLFYIVNKNFKYIEFIKDLVDLIEEYGEKILPSLFLTIYKRRDNAH